ncbi:carboxylic ester hydrolase [Favolaschia claudopus]|uniref:Carboxylic ester hydrolase n=1 Tax=Favolaschia claudopus TaxID=2862362 RepID=A0AAW0DGM0_9AGAR
MRSSLKLALALAFQACYVQSAAVSVSTSSGVLQGKRADGLMVFKGVRFGQPPTGNLRWAPPVAFTSHVNHNATTMGPSCVQQFTFARAAINQPIFNTPPPPEDEDCLFLNVWAPAPARSKLPVVVWIYGGALAFGTAWTPEYDGASLASNQNVVVVTFNYRTNVFGFPDSPDIPLIHNNLGFLDQDLALQWVQRNIAKFGGDPRKVTIMGQSSGAASVAAAYVRHAAGTAPFRGAIMLSGAVESRNPTPSFTSFNAMATALGCEQSPGAERLACLRAVSASTIRSYTNGPSSGTWTSLVDSVTVFSDPLQRIRKGQTSKVPFIIGHTEDDGTLFAINRTDLPTYLNATYGNRVTADQVRALYAPGLSDNALITNVEREFKFLCAAELWGEAAVSAGTLNVYRYAYGAVFSDLQFFPNLGAWHSSELFEIFGTYNRSTATAAEKTLSSTMQSIVGNFARNPAAPPAPHWPKYRPGNKTSTLAKLAYNSNVALSNVVQTVRSNSLDSPCDRLWNQLLDVRV